MDCADRIAREGLEPPIAVAGNTHRQWLGQSLMRAWPGIPREVLEPLTDAMETAYEAGRRDGIADGGKRDAEQDGPTKGELLGLVGGILSP